MGGALPANFVGLYYNLSPGGDCSAYNGVPWGMQFLSRPDAKLLTLGPLLPHSLQPRLRTMTLAP
jgi:hypothetical protein